jgi:hypothetical protein
MAVRAAAVQAFVDIEASYLVACSKNSKGFPS